MLLLALDISTKTGVAWARPGVRPRYDLWRLKRPQDDVEVACEEAARKIRDMCFIADTRPDKIVYEAPIPPYQNNGQDERERKIIRSVESIILPQQVIGAVRGLAACYGIECHGIHAATIRKHFLGRAHMGSPQATKQAVIDRCRLLKYVEPGFSENNVCDALATLDFGMARWGGKAAIPRELFMKTERASA